jgi:hypothetical protein
MVLGRFFRRWGLLLGVALLGLGVLPAHALMTHSCGGFAPSETACSTGTYTVTTTIAHDVSTDINYVGTLESQLIWSGGSRIFRCTYTQGLDRQCLASGPFPKLNSSVRHVCRSLIPGTSVKPADDVQLEGQQGGVGTWSCSVTV